MTTPADIALRVSRALGRAGLAVGPEELLDVLLAAGATAARGVAPVAPPPAAPLPPLAPPPSPLPPAAPPVPTPVATRYPVEAAGGGRAAERPGVPVRLPPPARPFRAAAVVRALRPFRRRIPSATEWEPDEEATAEAWGQSPVPVLRVRPRRVKEWTAHLVIDASASMEVWADTVAALARLVAGCGVFRAVRVLTADADADRLRVVAARGRGRAPVRLRPAPAYPPCGPRGAVLVVSDACSRAWWTGAAPRLFAGWGRTAAVGLVCVLPEVFWPRTALGRHRYVRLTRPADGGPLYVLAPPAEEGAVLPTASLDERSFATLPPLLGHNPRAALGGAVWVGPPDAADAAAAEAAVDWAKPADPAQPFDPAGAVRTFLASASPEAARLIGLAALFDRVTVTTLRLIRAAAALPATAAQDAEVLLGGLLSGERAARGERPGWAYRFRSGVAPALRVAGLLGGAPADAFLARFRAYLERRRDEASGVAAALPLAAGDRRVRTMEDQFLDLDADALAALGPRAAELAGELRTVQSGAASGAADKARASETASVQKDDDIARRLQDEFLPEVPEVPGYEFYAYVAQAATVGGDYYDFVALPGGRVAVAICDVAGKGLPAALFAQRLRSEARSCLLAVPDLTVAVGRLNERIISDGIGDRFATLAVLVIDPEVHEVTIVNAGHTSPRWHKARTGELTDAVSLEATGMPVGVTSESSFPSSRITLEPGDRVFLYTDGASDTTDPSGALFGPDGIDRVLAARHRGVRETGERMIAAVRAHASGRPQHDDIAVVGFGRVAAKAAPVAAPERRKVRSVFLCGNRREFAAELDAATRALNGAGVYVSSPKWPLPVYKPLADQLLSLIESSDAVVVLAGARYGSAPHGESLSWVEREYEMARGLELPIYAFTPAKAEARGSGDEPVELRERQARFRDRLRREAVCGTFSSPEELVAGVLRAVLPPKEPPPKPVPNNLPARVSDFVGRDVELAHLEQAREGIPGPRPVFRAAHALVGVGGIGKTTLAVEFAHRRAADYTALLFVPADSPDALDRGLADLCRLPGIDLPEATDPRLSVRREAVYRWLGAHPGWLLILDAMDTEPAAAHLARLLASSDNCGHVLFTGRRAVWSTNVRVLHVPPLTPIEGATLLAARTGRTGINTDPGAGESIAVQLKGHPLAIDWAAGLIVGSDTTFRHYDALLRKIGPDDTSPLHQVVPSALRVLSGRGRPLLATLSWLADGPIPRALFAVTLRTTTETGVHVVMQGSDVESGLEELTNHRLVEVGPGNVPRLRPLLAGVARQARIGDWPPGSPRDTVAWLAAFAPNGLDHPDWPALVPHVASAIGFASDEALANRDARFSSLERVPRLLSDLGRHYLAVGDYRAAGRTALRGLKLTELRGAAESPEHGRQLHSAGRIYLRVGDFASAQPLLEHALTIQEGGPVPAAERIVTMCDTAAARAALGRTDEAVGLFRRALEVVGAEPGDFGGPAARVGLGFALLDKYSATRRAEFLYEARELFEVPFRTGTTEEHRTEIVRSVRGLAATYAVIGDHAEAVGPLESVLAAPELLDGEPAERVSCLVALGRARAALGQYEVAADLLRRAGEALDPIPAVPLKDRLAADLAAARREVSGRAGG